MKRIFSYILLGVLLIALWQYFGSTDTTVRLYISSPSLVVQYFIDNYQSLLHGTLITFIEAVFGLLIAIGFSFLVMIIGFFKPKFLDFIYPIMVTSQVIPIIVLAPFFILLMGIGLGSKILMAAVISFFPVFVNFVQGYKAIPKPIHELMHIYKASTWFKIEKVYFPLSLPNIMAGIKVSATLAVIGAIVSEFAGAKSGIGKNLFVSSLRLDPDMMMTSLILASCIGLLMSFIVKMTEKKLGAWYL